MEKPEERTRNLVEELRADIDFELDDVVAKMVRGLSDDYFQSQPRRDQIKQLKALLAMGVCQLEEEITLRSEDGSRVAVVARRNYPGLLADILQRLPSDRPLVGAKIFTSKDHDFIIDLFEFQHDNATVEPEAPLTSDLKYCAEDVQKSTGASRDDVDQFLRHYPAGSAVLSSPSEVTDHFLAFRATRHANDNSVRWSDVESELSRVTISAGSAKAKDVFQRTAAFLANHSLDIEHAFLHEFPLGDDSRTALASFLIRGTVTDATQLASDLKLFLRLDRDVFSDPGNVDRFDSIADAELATALMRLVGHLLKFNGQQIPFPQIRRLTRQHQDAFTAVLNAIKSGEKTENLISLDHLNNPVERMVLATLNSINDSLVRTNLDQQDRRSCAFRFDQRLLGSLETVDQPFAVFYVYGLGFDGFHVRFRDVARGGMRLVRTRNNEHYLIESVRGLEEAYQLAAAQQLKNKDIAEGGAKATVILKPDTNVDRAGRDFVDGLLDLVIESSGNAHELLYLGPDENVSPQLIEWIVNRSRERGYPYAESLMSSKPRAGINHKQFGVTSEGVTVFLKRALRFAGKDPETASFTVKLTGGPDGDVAGNEIRILFRDFGERVKIVGIANGTGSAIDPKGLNPDELMRLVNFGLPICEFDPKMLSGYGRVDGLDTPEAVAQRNDLQFVVRSDVFIPAGGRPSTIHAGNWESYFDVEGNSAAPIIVEGANLFIDDVARKELSNRGVIIVKDSSANKCGVICSSLEIIAGMLLPENKFLEIKSVFVNQVLEVLRELAEIEAICLFNEQPRAPHLSLPELSVLISKKILHLGDLIFDEMKSWSVDDDALARQLVIRYLPDSLIETLGTELVDDIPPVYRNQLVAAILSSRVVYREGFQNLENMKDSDLAALALDHLRFECDTIRFIDALSNSNLVEAEQIAEILRHAGTRTQRELGWGV